MSKITAPTLEDVARMAGVSTASISRALNDPDKVAKPTRDRIERAIETLGYTPNFGGRALASSRTNTVGAIIPSMANAMFASGVQAFQEVLSEAGINLLLATTGYDPEQELRHIKALIAHGADGLMLIGHARPQATRDFLSKRRVPYVVSWCFRDEEQLFVGFDNYKAAYDAAQKVLELGHRRIAMISGLHKGNDRARDRYEGVAAAISDFGETAQLVCLEEAGYRLEYGAEAFGRIMALDVPLPTAVICGSDVHAAGALMRARDMRLDVPGRVSIVGFDDIGLALVVTPPLATVRVPQIEMGRAAARALLARLSGQSGVASVELPTEFIHRASLSEPSR